VSASMCAASSGPAPPRGPATSPRCDVRRVSRDPSLIAPDLHGGKAHRLRRIAIGPAGVAPSPVWVRVDEELWTHALDRVDASSATPISMPGAPSSATRRKAWAPCRRHSSDAWIAIRGPRRSTSQTPNPAGDRSATPIAHRRSRTRPQRADAPAHGAGKSKPSEVTKQRVGGGWRVGDTLVTGSRAHATACDEASRSCPLSPLAPPRTPAATSPGYKRRRHHDLTAVRLAVNFTGLRCSSWFRLSIACASRLLRRLQLLEHGVEAFEIPP